MFSPKFNKINQKKVFKQQSTLSAVKLRKCYNFSCYIWIVVVMETEDLEITMRCLYLPTPKHSLYHYHSLPCLKQYRDMTFTHTHNSIPTYMVRRHPIEKQKTTQQREKQVGSGCSKPFLHFSNSPQPGLPGFSFLFFSQLNGKVERKSKNV